MFIQFCAAWWYATDEYAFDADTPSPKGKKAGPAKAKAAAKPKDAAQKRPLAKKPAAKAKAAAKPVAHIDNDSPSEGPTPQPKKTKRVVVSPTEKGEQPTEVSEARPGRSARAVPKKSYVVEDSEDESDASEDWESGSE